jgi:apolipoprotein D and lipocalin family protein
MLKNLLILLFLLNLFSCKTNRDLSTVNEVNLEKYAGQWYEIARLPNKFEKGLKCVTATYSLKKNEKIEVLNKGFSTEKIGEAKSVKGTAWIPNPEFQGRLKVSFFWPFAGNYYIISLDEEYQYVLVGDPSRKYLWILSRTKQLDEIIYSRLLDIAKQKGFKVEEVIIVDQNCEQ